MAITHKAEVRDGHFVSQRVAQVIEAIREWEPEIEVQWIPPDARSAGDAAFRIMHYPAGREPYVIRHVKSEEEFDSRILYELMRGDQRNGALKLSDIEAAEAAAKAVAKQRARDEMEESIEKMYYVFRSKLNTYRLDKDTVIKDGIPFNAKGY